MGQKRKRSNDEIEHKEKKRKKEDPEERKTNPFTFRPYSKRYYEILEVRKQLPAWEARPKLKELLESH